MTAPPRTSPASRRLLNGSILRAEPAHVYKADRRSKVWRVDRSEGSVVVKRFEYARIRQCLAALLQIHPAQRERRRNRQLIRAGLPVSPVIGWGVTRTGKFWLATPYQGTTLHRRLRNRELDDPTRNRQVTAAVGQLVGRLIATGFFFRDLKTTNILVDDDGHAWLIDVGSVRPIHRRRDTARMLAILDHTATLDGASRTTRLRALNAAARECPSVRTVRERYTQMRATG